jgi:cysteine synthase
VDECKRTWTYISSPCFLECLELILTPADDEGGKAALVLNHAFKTEAARQQTQHSNSSNQSAHSHKCGLISIKKDMQGSRHHLKATQYAPWP